MKPIPVIVIAVFVVGCGTQETPIDESAKPTRKNAADHLRAKEARADTEKALNGLLAGSYDDDAELAPVAKRLKGFTKWTIDSREVDPESPGTLLIGGRLSGPAGEARFSASMHRMVDGHWELGTFNGPQN
jgi:hypothetical protein